MRTFAEFQHHIQLHRERVVILGLALAKNQFPGLNLRPLEAFLYLHDHSKTLNSRDELALHSYTHTLTPSQRLFEFYGKIPESEMEHVKLIEVVNDINTIDTRVCARFFEMNPGLSRGTQDDFYTIEKVADLVDRSLDPVAAEEFGHPMILASEYVQDPYMSLLSIWLEKNYLQITKNLTFEKTLRYKMAE